MCTATRRPHSLLTNVRRSRSTTKARVKASRQRRKRKVWLGFRDNFVDADTGCGLDQMQAIVGDVDDGKVGEDSAHTTLAGQWQRAVLDDLRGAVLGGVFHHHENFFTPVHWAHPPALALDYLAGVVPVAWSP